MSTIKRIALLEDNQKTLDKMESFIMKIPDVDIVLKSKSSEDFFKQLETSYPDILITDLDLGNDSMTGMEVAQEIKIPVFFASINTSDYVMDMEKLKRDYDICVDHITKPFNETDFTKSLTRFLKEVQLFSNLQFVYLDFGKSKRNKILIDDIVYLSSDKQSGSESNNKQIHFINRKSESLIDFSFSKMEEKGLMKNQFVTIHKSLRVNKKYINCYNSKTEKIEIDIFDVTNKTKCHYLPVSENFQIDIKKLFG